MKKMYPSAECEECGKTFTQNRVDKQFCSGRCKSKNFRRVQKDKLTALERMVDKISQHSDLVAA